MNALVSLSNDLAAAVEQAGRSVVAIHARRRIPSSGILWRPGVVVAANHTVRRDEDIAITLPDGSRAEASVAGRDPGTDLAVLSLAGGTHGGAEVARTADSGALQVGRIVLAVGRPGEGVTASLGIISAIGGEYRTWQGGRIDRLVRLDIAIYDGFSGGPLVDASGRVLGLNTSGLARAAALAIPASTVDAVTDQLLKRGRIARGYLGVGLQAVKLPESLVKAHALPGDAGLLAISVEPGGPADRAGILLGDVLVAWGGTPVSDPGELLAALGPESVGQEVVAWVVRGGKPTEARVTVGERPARGR